MGTLRVTAAGLAEFATGCDREAANSVAARPPLIEGNFRSTAAAVHGVHAEVAAAGQRISVRLTWTGEMASAASAAYDTQDGNAAAGLENLNFGFAEV